MFEILRKCHEISPCRTARDKMDIHDANRANQEEACDSKTKTNDRRAKRVILTQRVLSKIIRKNLTKGDMGNEKCLKFTTNEN